MAGTGDKPKTSDHQAADEASIEELRRLGARACDFHGDDRPTFERLTAATCEAILAEIAKVRDRNGLDDGDPPNVAAGKTAVLALCTVFENAARAGAAGVEQQLDIAFEIGRLFGIVVRARGLSPGGARRSVEDLAAAFGSGAYRAATQEGRR